MNSFFPTLHAGYVVIGYMVNFWQVPIFLLFYKLLDIICGQKLRSNLSQNLMIEWRISDILTNY